MNVVAVVMAGGAGTRLTVLSEKRAKPSVPFAGKYRIIDFTLSNCVNSNIFNIAVLTQYRPHSLNEHIGIGKPWDLDRASGGVRLLQPYQVGAVVVVEAQHFGVVHLVDVVAAQHQHPVGAQLAHVVVVLQDRIGCAAVPDLCAAADLIGL